MRPVECEVLLGSPLQAAEEVPCSPSSVGGLEGEVVGEVRRGCVEPVIVLQDDHPVANREPNAVDNALVGAEYHERTFMPFRDEAQASDLGFSSENRVSEGGLELSRGLFRA